MTEKLWTHEQITTAAEEQIVRSMEAAKRYELAQDTTNRAHNEMLAFGAYLVWRSITNGHRLHGDDERIAKLVGAEA